MFEPIEITPVRLVEPPLTPIQTRASYLDIDVGMRRHIATDAVSGGIALLRDRIVGAVKKAGRS